MYYKIQSITSNNMFQKIIKIFLIAVLSLALIMPITACTNSQNASNGSTQTSQKTSQKEFEYWNQDAESLKVLKDYVADVTNSKSSNFIPEENRIAVFDVDGTLYGELAPIYVEWNMYAYRVLKDPTYKCTDSNMIRVANEIVEAGKTKKISDNLEKEHAKYAQVAFAGMTVEEYSNYVTEYLKQPAEGFNNATYADMWFLPMLNVVDYLNSNGFTVYAVSGTDRIMVRTMLKNKGVNIDPSHVIGMDCELCANGKIGQDMLDYQFNPEDKVVRGDKLLVKNVKMNKVSQIAQEIGKKPVLSFGNSSGDISMATYVTSDNPYKSAAFMVVADDTERDYGNAQKAQQLTEKWKQLGWTCFSEKNDFATIYDSKVTKIK